MNKLDGGVMDIQKEREAFLHEFEKTDQYRQQYGFYKIPLKYDEQKETWNFYDVQAAWEMWQAKARAVPAQLDVNSILHHIDCYFDNGLSNTERTANNLLQSIYEKLSGEVKAQEPAND